MRPAVALLLLVVGNLAAAAPRRTLAELVEMARARAAQVAVAEAQRHVAQAQHFEARSLWAPTGQLTYLLTGAPNVQCQVPVADEKLYPNGVPSEVRQRDCINTIDPTAPVGSNGVSYLSLNIGGIGMQGEVTFVQPIFTFGKIENAVAAADHGLGAGDAAVEAARREAALNVARAYWGLKMARASEGVLASAKDELVPWRNKIEKDLDSDKPKYTESDLSRVKVALHQLELAVLAVKKGGAVALAGLRLQVGDGEVDVDEAEFAPVVIRERKLDEWQDDLEKSRPEVRQLDEGRAGLHDLARARRDEMLPDLALTGGVNFRYASSVEDADSAFMTHANQFGFGAFLTLRQPLDFVGKVARWKHAEADAEVLDAQRDGALIAMRLEVEKAFADVGEARARLDELDAWQHDAQGWLHAQNQAMDLGESDPRTLVDAARSYFEARMAYLQAIMDYNVAVAALEKATGQTVLNSGAPAPSK